MRQKILKNDRANRVVLFLLNLFFYMIFPLMDGAVWCRDSQSYVSMEVSREPLYPLFLKFLRDVFWNFGAGETMFRGLPAYLFGAVILQSVLAAYAGWRLSIFLGGMHGSRKWKKTAMTAGTLSLWGVAFLNRFAAGRSAAYHESIMTEGLAFSLYVLLVIRITMFEQKQRKTDLLLTMLLIFLCVSLRKQLMTGALLFGAAEFLRFLGKRRKFRHLAGMAVLTLSVLGGCVLFDYAYNYRERGIWMQHTGNEKGICCTLLYTSGEADVRHIEGENGDLFRKIREESFRQGLLYENLSGGEAGSWEIVTTHYADSYDAIGYGVLMPMIQDHLRELQPDLEGPQLFRQMDVVEREFRNGLIRQNPERFLKIWGFNAIKGAVNSILRMHPFLNPAAGILYIFYTGMLICLSKRGKRGPELLFGGIVLLGILINSAAVGAMIFPQPRYMIYSMALFYAAFIVLALSFFEKGK